MAFDAGMATAVVSELKKSISGARVEKVFQPSKDEVVLSLRTGGKNIKLLISVNPASARVCATALERENPKTPPMFCMLLRKHLTGTVVEDIYMYGFERVIEISFSARDEMGFPCVKYLTTEIMGKCSNLFLLEDEKGKKKIIASHRPADFATATRRRVIAGAEYELPPPQNKADPRYETEEGFCRRFSEYPPTRGADRFIVDEYLGISPLVARECVFRAGAPDSVKDCSPRMLWRAFSDIASAIREGAFEPCVLTQNGKPFEYSFMRIRQYGEAAKALTFSSFSEMFDFYFGERERAEAMRARTHDVEAVIASACRKLEKKLPLLHGELAECAEADKMRLWGDLIMSSVYLLTKKADSCEVVNYFSDDLETVTVPLDIKLTPAQNAARYYKKYNKYKTAKKVLTEQIEKTERELEYLQTVKTALSLCETEADAYEIRLELAQAGYSAKAEMINKARSHIKLEPKRYVTSGGYECIVGKNNMQNDRVTTKLAKKSDWWFHVKGGAGSHVVMVCGDGEEPDAQSFTEAAQLAAYFSSFSSGENVAVDYTKIKNVKKPAGAVAGYVIYTSNYTAYVDPKCECREI